MKGYRDLPTPKQLDLELERFVGVDGRQVSIAQRLDVSSSDSGG